jgi:hypothetical protein
VVATIGLTFISSALKQDDAVREHLAQVKDISLEISNRLAQLNSISDGGKALSDGNRLGQVNLLPN